MSARFLLNIFIICISSSISTGVGAAGLVSCAVPFPPLPPLPPGFAFLVAYSCELMTVMHANLSEDLNTDPIIEHTCGPDIFQVEVLISPTLHFILTAGACLPALVTDSIAVRAVAFHHGGTLIRYALSTDPLSAGHIDGVVDYPSP